MKHQDNKSKLGHLKEAIISLLLLFIVFYSLVLVVIPRKVAKITGFGVYRVTSGSMQPRIMINDIVVATYPNINSLKSGDIIVFRTIVEGKEQSVTHYFSHISEKNHIVTYRIDEHGRKINDRWLNRGRQHFVFADDVIGKTVFRIPTGVVINFLFSYLGITFVFSLMSCFFFLAKFKEEEREDNLIDLLSTDFNL